MDYPTSIMNKNNFIINILDKLTYFYNHTNKLIVCVVLISFILLILMSVVNIIKKLKIRKVAKNIRKIELFDLLKQLNQGVINNGVKYVEVFEEDIKDILFENTTNTANNVSLKDILVNNDKIQKEDIKSIEETEFIEKENIKEDIEEKVEEKVEDNIEKNILENLQEVKQEEQILNEVPNFDFQYYSDFFNKNANKKIINKKNETNSKKNKKTVDEPKIINNIEIIHLKDYRNFNEEYYEEEDYVNSLLQNKNKT